jgi:putative CocE/NonD family hydrolase
MPSSTPVPASDPRSLLERFSADVERNVPVPMRDGTVLRADVWRPAGEGRHPTLLQRLPYNKADAFITGHLFGLEPLRAVGAGFAVVLQDTRGRYASEGTFEPFARESDDGADTIAWIADQPFSDGDVCMYGSSYVGATQLLAAASAPPALRAVAPGVTASEYYEGWTYQGGALQLGFALHWALGSLGGATVATRQMRGEDVAALAEELGRTLADMWPAYERLPLTDQPLLHELCPAYFEWLRHPQRDEHWRAIAPDQRYAEMTVPALHVGGWSDIFVDGTLRNYAGLREHAATEEARQGQRLLIGPWAHGNVHEVVGELDFTPSASQLALDMTAVQLDFFERVLSGRGFDTPPVRIFVMGANQWRDEDAWPIARTRHEHLHLRGDGRANTAAGDGRLSREPAGADEPSDRYVYDPRQPVPTIGGKTLMPSPLIGIHSGPRDQREVETRTDVLVYTGDPLECDTEVTGTVTLVLTAASSAVDTDFTAKLVDVHPDGRAIGIVDGILRARYRDGLERPRLLEPGRPERLTIELGATSMLFRAGHRIRLEVSSSNFPRFDRHPNVGGDLSAVTEAELVPAQQTVFHDADRPSYLVLPIVDDA